MYWRWLYQEMRVVLLLCMGCWSVLGGRAWERPGCHKLAFEREVNIDNCVRFRVLTNACRGYCNSYAYPTPFLIGHPYQDVTSRAECCSIATTHDVIIEARCLDGIQRFTFKSAETCACSVCRHN